VIALSDLIENFCAQNRRKTLRSIFVHFGTACPHNSRRSCECIERFRARRVPHPAYSSEMALNDFFFFGHLKIKLAGPAIQSREELILTIRRIFDEIPKEMLILIYLLWKKIVICDQEQDGIFSFVIRKEKLMLGV
jgi:hypothetical protein